jgi:hypothetical protein
VGALKKQLRLDRPCTKEEEAHIFNKSQKYISRVISKWVQDYGFVVQIRGNVKKTPQFEEAWKRQRERWICQVHDGVTENILELRQTTSSSKEASPENGLRKRVMALHSISVADSQLLTICSLLMMAPPKFTELRASLTLPQQNDTRVENRLT